MLSKHQSGFRPGIYQLLAEYSQTSKTFDTEWHDGLLFKLKQNGVSGNLLGLIKSFLSDRDQRVTFNGKASDWESIRAGVPQGSILGPLFS